MTAMNSSDNLAQEPEQQARRRRILFAALQPFMKRDALYQALWEWEEQHAQQPTASLHRFIAALCSAPPLTARRNDVNRNLVMVMQPGDAALGPDPMHEMLAHRRRVNGTPQPGGSSPVAERSPANVVLETIVAGLNGRLARHGPQVYPSYTGYVLENLSMLRLPLSAEVAVASLIRNADNRLVGSYAPESMQALLHMMYVGACEYYGPVKTDEMLAAAVSDAERLPQALLFPPRMLL